MQSLMKLSGRRSAPGPVAAIVVGATAWALTVTPILAQPATGETLANAVVAACTGLTWAELQGGFAGNDPTVGICRQAVHDSFLAAIALTADDQERIGLAFVAVLSEPVEAGAANPYPAVNYVLGSQFDGYLFEYCSPTMTGTAQTCTAVFRMVTVAGQAMATDFVNILVTGLCGAIAQNYPWRAEIIAVVDELAARAATGTDPVMQVRIDDIVTGTAACR